MNKPKMYTLATDARVSPANEFPVLALFTAGPTFKDGQFDEDPVGDGSTILLLSYGDEDMALLPGAPPPGESYTLLNLSAGTIEDHLAAVLAHWKLPQRGTYVRVGRQIGYVRGYQFTDDVRCMTEVEGPWQYIPAAEAAVLTVIEEGETDEALEML